MTGAGSTHSEANRNESSMKAQPSLERLRAPGKNIVSRAYRRIGREMRWHYWHRKLAHLGPGSDIERPDNIAGVRSIWIGASVRIWWRARIEAMCDPTNTRCVVIGDNTVIHPYIHIGAVQSVEIGRGVLIAARTYITDHDHDFLDPMDPPISNGRLLVSPVHIGDYVWLGEGVMILKGVHIGARSIIGAGSIVTRSIPPHSIAVGAPARVIKRYDASAGRWVKDKGSHLDLCSQPTGEAPLEAK